MTMRTSFVGVRDLYEGSFLTKIFMSEGKPELTACHECDLLLREPAIEQIQGASTCPRCAAVLSRADRDSLDKSLALACAALVLLLLANLFPIVGLNIQGQNVEATVFGAARQLWNDNMRLVSVLVFATTVLVPLFELGALVWLLLPLRLGRRPPGFVYIFKLLRLVHPWTMVEVFMLGILVALVKLSHMADVLPGTAIWCFGLLMLALAALSSVLNRRVLWAEWEGATA
jgi:paraquat-inducible protein A